MPKITLDMSTNDMIVALAAGNMGAATTCIAIMDGAPEIEPDSFAALQSLLALDALGIYGERLYILWHIVCNRNTGAMIAVLRAQLYGIVAKSAIDQAIDTLNPDEIDLREIIEAVKEEIPGFNASI